MPTAHNQATETARGPAEPARPHVASARGGVRDWGTLAVGLCVLLVSLIHVGPDEVVPNYFDPPKLLVWTGLAAVLAIVWLGIRRARVDLVSGASIALLLWMVGRTVARPRWDTEWEVLVTWTLPVLFFVLARGLALRPRLLGAVLLCAAAVQACLMVLQRCGHDPLFAATTASMSYAPARMIGTVGYQNQAVDFLALAAVGVWVSCRRWSVRVALLLLLLGVVALTGVRLGLGALAVAVVCAFLAGRRSRRGRLLTVLWVVLALAVAAALVPETRARLLALATPGRADSSVGSRALMWRMAAGLWADHPLVGSGAGEYAFQYVGRLGGLLPDEKTHAVLRNVVFAREAHNDYLQFGAEFGLLGVLLAGLVFGLAVREVLRRTGDPDCRVGLAYVGAYMLVAGLAAFPWQASCSGPLAGLLLGTLTAPATEVRRATVPGPGAAELLAVAGRGLVLVWALCCCAWGCPAAVLNQRVLQDAPTEDILRQASALPPGTCRYEATWGGVVAAKGDTAQATALLERALPGYRDVMLYRNLGFVYAKMGKWKQAADAYACWARTGIEYQAALKNLATASENAGLYAKAAAALDRQLRLWPAAADGATVLRLANLRLFAGDAAGALAAVETYERGARGPGRVIPAELDNIAGAALLRLGKADAAAERFRAALAKKPDLISARRNLERLGSGKTRQEEQQSTL